MENLEKVGGEDKGRTSEIKTVALASLIGTTVEWFDFFAYSTAAALVFGTLFFPGSDPLIGTLLAFSTLAVGYFARPVGAIVFGHFGDRIGRKTMLIISLLMMGGATFLIGLLPTYATIGVAAPILLVSLRFIQGLALGGEWGGAVLMAIEHSPRGRRGFYGSWPQTGVALGLLLSTLIYLAVAFLPDAQFAAWGWRVPFLVSIVLVVLGLFVRLKIMETPEFARVRETQSEARLPFLDVFRNHAKEVLLTALAYLAIGGTFYVLYSFGLSYGTTYLELERGTMLTIVSIASVFNFFVLLLFGHLSDRLGRKRVYMAGNLLMIAGAFPMFWLINTQVFALMLLGFLLGTTGFAAAYGPMAALFAESFETRVRYTGISLGLTIGTVAGGSLVPAIATGLLDIFDGSWPVSVYLILVGVVSAIATALLKLQYSSEPSKTTSHKSLMDEQAEGVSN